MVSPDALKQIDEYFRTKYKDEIEVFIETMNKIEEGMNENGSLLPLKSQPPDKQDKLFAILAWHGDNSDLEKYARRFLISTAAYDHVQTVVESGNDPRLTKADYELFKRTAQKLGGWLYFEVSQLRRAIVDTELLLRKEAANNKILSEGLAEAQRKLEECANSKK